MEENSLIKLLVVSDNHSRMEPIREIPGKFPDVDYFLHLGDSREPVRRYGPYAQVRGNNDYYDVPEYLVLDIGAHRLFLTHGTRLAWFGQFSPLAERAKAHGCDIALFGHTHIYSDETVEGVRCLNPGSVWHNRDGSDPSFMIVELEGSEIRAFRMNGITLNSAD
jgi:hypothetical protein